VAGVAILVPDIPATSHVCSSAPDDLAEKVLCPGATTSGLIL
jgi:hypothetical protein